MYHKRNFQPVEMMALHRLADFCVVSSLHDGMNLVAKEFVASRFDEDGVLLLSQFAGSALELTDAVLFNPYAVEELAEAIHQAVEMPPERAEAADAADADRRAGKQRLPVGWQDPVGPAQGGSRRLTEGRRRGCGPDRDASHGVMRGASSGPASRSRRVPA